MKTEERRSRKQNKLKLQVKYLNTKSISWLRYTSVYKNKGYQIEFQPFFQLEMTRFKAFSEAIFLDLSRTQIDFSMTPKAYINPLTPERHQTSPYNIEMTSEDKKFNKFELKPDSRFYRTFQEENFIKKFPDVSWFSWLGMHPVISFFNATGVNLRELCLNIYASMQVNTVVLQN